MGVQILEMGVKLRKVVIFTFRRSYRLVCNHPFLVGMLLFLIFLHRSSPFVFSLLVTASPVLVCTAVLLGTLLSFGQPHIPEIERGEKCVNEIGSLRTGVSRDTVVVQKSEGFSVERVAHRSGEIVEHSNRDLGLGCDTSRDLFRADSFDSNSPLIGERSREIKLEREEGEGRKLLHESENNQKNEMQDERLVDRQAKTEDEELELDNDKSPAESFDSERVNVDSLDSPPGSPWKHVEEEEELAKGEAEDEEEDAEDTDSDQAESSSPDASMADIIPLLDELHPLLDEDAAQPNPSSHYGSDAASEHSEKSGDISSESEDDVEKHEELQGADVENEDADDEEEEHSNKESQTKAAITWTEEDQRNLMDLGSSELERNQRLESLMARRRARKTMSMMPERNLIDLETVDLPHNVAPIITSRNNPFDHTHDSYDSMGLPPIPGSAPSILLPRRNPFDIPYDSSEEKPDLLGDSFQQEFSPLQSKEPLFRRRESFNVGPSIFGPSRQDKQDIRFRPFFVPERSDLEESGYSPFQRQSSGLSESKTSSVPETESVVSNADIEENNLMEENATPDAGTLNFVAEIELRNPASDLEPRNFFGGDFSQELEPLMKLENDNSNEEDFSQETEVIAKMEDVSEQVGHGSQSSEEEDSSSEVGEIEERGLKVDKVDGHLVRDTNHQVENLTIEERGVSSPLELHDGVQMQGQLFQQGSDANKESGSVGDVQLKEPIYDSSPTSMRKNLSSSSALSELHIESERGSPSVLIKGTISFAERESELGMHALEGTSASKETPPVSCPNHLPTENQSEASMVTNLREIDVLPTDKGSNSTIAAESPLDTAVQGNSMNQLGKHGSTDKQISSVIGAKVDGAPQQNVESLASSSKDKSADHPKEQLHSEEILHRKSTDDHRTAELSLDNGAFQAETSKAPSSSSGKIDDAVSLKPDEKQIYLNGQPALEDKSLSDLDEELVFLDRIMDESSSRYQHELQESLVMPEEISEELSPRESSNVSYIQDLETVPTNINSPTSPESINIPSEAYESRAIEGYSDDEFENYNLFQSTKGKAISAENSSLQAEMERRDYLEDLIKGIGEDLLSELDTVGDFSVKNLNSGSDLFGTNVASDKATEKIMLAMQDQIVAKPRVVENSNIDAKFEMPVIEAQSKKDLEAIFKKAESTSSNGLDSSDMSGEGKATQNNNSKMPIVEAQNVVDVDLKDEKGQLPETKMQLQNVVEAGSANDTNLNKQHHAEDSVKPTVPDYALEGHVVKPILIQKPVPSSGKDSEKNEAATLNDQQSSMKDFSVPGLKNNAGGNSDGKVAASEMSHDESKGKESILSSGEETEKNENSTSNDRQLSTKKSAVEGSRSIADVSSDATVAPSDISVVSHDAGMRKESVLPSGKDSEKNVGSAANDQQSSMKESTVEGSAKSAGVSSNAKVAESEIASHDEGKVKEPILASGKDSEKNEAGALNDQKSSAKGSTVKGSESSAGVSSEAKVASSDSSVVSRDGGNVKDSVLASIKDSEKNVAATANDQQLRARDSTVKESESGADVSSKAKVAASDSSVVSHDGGKVKESILTSVKDSEKNVAGAANDQQLSVKDSMVKGSESSADASSGAKVAASESSVVSHDGGKMKESVLASGKDSEKSEAGAANDQLLHLKESTAKGSESSGNVTSEAKVAASESSVVSRDGGKVKESVLASRKDSEKNEASASNDQQSSIKESNVQGSRNNAEMVSDAKVSASESSTLSHDTGKEKASEKSSSSC